MRNLKFNPNRMDADERQEWERLNIPLDTLPYDRRTRMELLDHYRGDGHIPLWRRLGRIYNGLESFGETRRAGIRQLVTSAKWLMRKELLEHENDPEKAERTVYWDPLHEVCCRLEISQSKLSNLCRELTGLSASGTLDALKAERVTIKMRVALRAFLKSFLEGQKGSDKPLTIKDLDKWSVWKALKRSRRAPEFSHATWAMEYGFASYIRFYRGCIVTHGKTPHQLELEIIDELLKEDGKESEDPRARPAPTEEEIKKHLEELISSDMVLDPHRHFRPEEPGLVEKDDEL